MRIPFVRDSDPARSGRSSHRWADPHRERETRDASTPRHATVAWGRGGMPRLRMKYRSAANTIRRIRDQPDRAGSRQRPGCGYQEVANAGKDRGRSITHSRPTSDEVNGLLLMNVWIAPGPSTAVMQLLDLNSRDAPPFRPIEPRRVAAEIVEALRWRARASHPADRNRAESHRS